MRVVGVGHIPAMEGTKETQADFTVLSKSRKVALRFALLAAVETHGSFYDAERSDGEVVVVRYFYLHSFQPLLDRAYSSEIKCFCGLIYRRVSLRPSAPAGMWLPVIIPSIGSHHFINISPPPVFIDQFHPMASKVPHMRWRTETNCGWKSRCCWDFAPEIPSITAFSLVLTFSILFSSNLQNTNQENLHCSSLSKSMDAGGLFSGSFSAFQRTPNSAGDFYPYTDWRNPFPVASIKEMEGMYCFK